MNAKAAQEQVVRENGRQPFNGGKGCVWVVSLGVV
jgi:hypothetical protein